MGVDVLWGRDCGCGSLHSMSAIGSGLLVGVGESLAGSRIGRSGHRRPGTASTIGDLDGQGRASTARDGFGGLVNLAEISLKKQPQNVNNDVKPFSVSCAMTISRHCGGEATRKLRQSICRCHMSGNDADPFAMHAPDRVARVVA